MRYVPSTGAVNVLPTSDCTDASCAGSLWLLKKLQNPPQLKTEYPIDPVCLSVCSSGIPLSPLQIATYIFLDAGVRLGVLTSITNGALNVTFVGLGVGTYCSMSVFS